MTNKSWVRKPFIIGTLGLMLVNTSVPVNVYANKEVEKKVHIYKVGAQDEGVLELKEYLDLLGYTIKEAPNEDSIFTDEFAELIKQFQKDHDLTVTDELDEALLTFIEIQVLTAYLDILGYTVEEDPQEAINKEEDIFTEKLSETIKQYQKDNALEVTGELDEEIFDLIEEQALALKEEKEDEIESDEVDIDEESINENNEDIDTDNAVENNEDISQVEEIEQTEETQEVEQDEVEKEEITKEKATISHQKPALYKTQAIAEPTVLKNGMRHEKVKVLKADLKKLGFTVPGKGTNLYGKQTEQKVQAFQRYYGLAADGQAGPATFHKINRILKTPLQVGKRHKDTQKLKADLKTLGFTVPGKGTTLYGKQTETKVKEFQSKYGLVQNGIADEVTLQKINDLLHPSVLENGMRHNRVQTLKANLNKLGFRVPGKGTTLYGKQTEAKVKEFQRYYGLSVTGKVDNITENKITSILKTPLQRGKRHNDTKKLKANLKTLGFTVPGKGTTLYGKQTETKVKEFQRKYGLVQNGIADEVTLKKLDELVKAKQHPSVLKNGVRHQDVKTLKANLKKLGFRVPGKGTTLYGKQTEAKVKEFQKYYGLSVTGKVDRTTATKITSILKTPLQRGKRHNDTKKLKANLESLGFAVPGSGTTLYGRQTEAKVKEFQRKYGLVQNGIADEVTLKKISDLMKVEHAKPQEITEYTNYGLTLDQAVTLQLEKSAPQTDKYRNDPAYVSVNYIIPSGKGTVNDNNVIVRTSPRLNANNAYTLNANSTVNILKEVKGSIAQGSDVWYEISNNGKLYYIHSQYVNVNEGKVKSAVNVRANSNASSHIYGRLAVNQKVTIIDSTRYWHQIEYKSWRKPTKTDLKNAMNPNNGDKFQHLRLDSLAGATARQLNNMLAGKGILANQGQAFINGAKSANINEAYLVSHAILETGNGTSKLANGIEVGKDNAGTPTVVTKSNRKSLTQVKKVYNMFGIGAHDRNPNKLGAIEAYNRDWDTPTKAIEGGARWVGQGYIHNVYSQNTIYKMRWNPQMNNGAVWKQYASDMNWANKQIGRIKEVYEYIDKPQLHFDVPKFK